MNKQNIILDFEDILNTYKTKIPSNQLIVLKSRNWFPLFPQLEEDIAYLIGKVMGDGNLDKTYIPRFIGQERDLILLKYLITKTFSINASKLKMTRRQAKGVSYLLQVNDVLLGRLLAVLGAPIGNKTKISFSVPFWIIKNKSYSKRFLQALLEDELSTIKIEKNNYAIKPRLKLAKERKLMSDLALFLTQIKSLLEESDIKCSKITRNFSTKLGQKTIELYFNINRTKVNIITFAKNIGFRLNTEKIKNLAKCVEILKKTKFVRKPFIDTPRILILRKKGFTIRQISKLVKLNPASVHRVIVKNKKNAEEGI